MIGMSPYCAMGNNPVLHTDQNGHVLPLLADAAIAAVGGGFNLYNNWDNDMSLRDGLAAFSKVAGAGLVGALSGGAVLGAVGLGAATTTLSAGTVLAGGAVGGVEGQVIY